MMPIFSTDLHVGGAVSLVCVAVGLIELDQDRIVHIRPEGILCCHRVCPARLVKWKLDNWTIVLLTTAGRGDILHLNATESKLIMTRGI